MRLGGRGEATLQPALTTTEGTDVLVVGFPAGVFATNCYVVAPGPGERCVVVDPGQDVAAALDQVLREHGVRPAAVLLTHGHIDHMWSVLPVCGAHGVPAYVHPADRDRLADPLATTSPDLADALGLAGIRFSEPDDVRSLADSELLDVAGLTLAIDHAPGHTQGSVVFRTPGGGPDGAPVMLCGDLLFAGSIGRTDLPGGDPEAMNRSLSRVCRSGDLPDETVVLPGHGPRTTLGRERAHNPYLRGLEGAGSGRAVGGSVR